MVVMADANDVVEVLLTEPVELLGLAVVELASPSMPSVAVALGLILGITVDVLVLDPSSVLATKRPAAARSRHKQRHSHAFARGVIDNSITPSLQFLERQSPGEARV